MFLIKLPQYSTQDIMTDRLKYAINCREDPLSGWGEGEGGKEVVGIVVMVWWGLELYQLLCFILIKRESIY